MSSKDAASRAVQLLNTDQIINSLNEKIPEYANHVGSRLRSVIWNETTANLLEIQVFASNDVEWESPLWTERPPINSDWVSAFYKWTKGRSLGGHKLRAGIEPISVQACIDASVSYFTSEEHVKVIGQGLVDNLKINKAVQNIVIDQLKSTSNFTKREIEDLMKLHSGNTVAQHTHDVISASMHHLLHTNVGVAMAHMLGAALTLPAIKVAIAKAVIIALSHAAIQHVLVVAAKHAGVAVIAVLFFGSAGASILSFMLFPIIAGVLTYQYFTLPETLAEKITPQVVEALTKQAPEINKAVTVSVSEAIFREFFKLSKGTLEKLHDTAMDSWDG